MGTVISFPRGRRSRKKPVDARLQGPAAAVVILPVVRIERWDDDQAPSAKSRTPATRSRAGRRK